MKVKDFIDVIRPLTTCDPDSDIEFFLFMNELEIHSKKGHFECIFRVTNAPIISK